jgi:REP element-mobilizing transposase RayT
MSMDKRREGWLDNFFHLRFRELLLHVCARYQLACAVYTLMPDHAHLLLLGLSEKSDQRLAVAYLRKHWNGLLPEGFILQRQAYDHVLRREECARHAFEAIAWYILENPVRKKLSATPLEWRFCGCMVPGHATLDPRIARFWDWFWKVIDELKQKH